MVIGGRKLTDNNVRAIAIGVAAMMLFVVFPLILFGINLRSAITPQPATRYTETRYFPAKQRVCVGDTVTFTPTLEVKYGNRVIELTTTWWDVAGERTARQARYDDGTITRSIFRDPGTVSRAISIDVPQLFPGEYEIIRSAQDTRSNITSLTSIPVTVMAC